MADVSHQNIQKKRGRSVAAGSKKTISSWVPLFRELRKRTIEPAMHASFVMYFVAAVVLVGGSGVWLEMYSYLFYVPTPDHPMPSVSALRTAVIAFFPALAGSSCMQLIWAEDEKSLRAFAIVALACLTCIVLVIGPAAISTPVALWVGVLASIAALWTWWIANAKQGDLLDKLDIDAPTGRRDTGGDLAGSLDQFEI